MNFRVLQFSVFWLLGLGGKWEHVKMQYFSKNMLLPWLYGVPEHVKMQFSPKTMLSPWPYMVPGHVKKQFFPKTMLKPWPYGIPGHVTYKKGRIPFSFNAVCALLVL